ncbi:hypothetical protein [Streptomyces sp. NBC_01264]|uniref:hypothetical protein n=1 Tax=Streptomyces sp. NBC_01264 TaxID=2903804 RepID=UPI00225411F7|nr:hypothetical protein [Streptomyces sp. NBC_01264]MCX4778134.1 hypothetical protein [Streptomyces sp. NBC_01264]
MTDWPTSKRSHKGRPSLTAEQQDLADELHMRALALRTASDGDLSITEAVHLAAVQLGLEAPAARPDETPD